jgi:putative transposase
MTEQTFFVTANAYMRQSTLQNHHKALLLIDVLLHYRHQGEYLLHEFVVMPDHLHVILSPNQAISKAAQLIKGNFSFRAKKELGYSYNVWQPGFHDHRIRDFDEYCAYRKYVWFNPVKRGLVSKPEDYPHSSASGRFALDPIPERLRPSSMQAGRG